MVFLWLKSETGEEAGVGRAIERALAAFPTVF
jgi:hypothetical protein